MKLYDYLIISARSGIVRGRRVPFIHFVVLSAIKSILFLLLIVLFPLFSLRGMT